MSDDSDGAALLILGIVAVVILAFGFRLILEMAR